MENNIHTIRKMLTSIRPHLHEKKNVVATGMGYKFTSGKKTPDLSIVCSVKKKETTRALTTLDMIPKDIEGIPTDVFETGIIRSLNTPLSPEEHQKRYRPVPGGVSIGHKDVTAGTLGCMVRKEGQFMGLTNNHVAAMSNEANIGDPILQPGNHDGGTLEKDHFADLAAFVPIIFMDSPSNCPIANAIARLFNGMAAILGSQARVRTISSRAAENRVDAAIIKPLKENSMVTDYSVFGIGPVTELSSGDLGTRVKKSGRTTGVTEGEILQVDVTVNVSYGLGKMAQFVEQMIAGPMSQGGDSGSAILNEKNQLIGLLFAGSDTTTVFNPIDAVFSALKLELKKP